MPVTRRKMAAMLGAAITIGGISGGIALGQTGGPGASAPVTEPPAAAGPTAPAATAPTTPETGAAEPSGPDTDSVQEGDQTTPDRPGEAAESAESGKEGGPEQADANEPAGGHEDAPGTDVDHQHEGVE